jgi:hypothetical protein
VTWVWLVPRGSRRQADHKEIVRTFDAGRASRRRDVTRTVAAARARDRTTIVHRSDAPTDNDAPEQVTIRLVRVAAMRHLMPGALGRRTATVRGKVARIAMPLVLRGPRFVVVIVSRLRAAASPLLETFMPRSAESVAKRRMNASVWRPSIGIAR